MINFAKSEIKKVQITERIIKSLRSLKKPGISTIWVNTTPNAILAPMSIWLKKLKTRGGITIEKVVFSPSENISLFINFRILSKNSKYVRLMIICKNNQLCVIYAYFLVFNI